MDVPVDIWKMIITKYLLNNYRTVVSLLWVCQKSRKAVLHCNFWKTKFPLRVKFYKATKAENFGLFCMYFTVERERFLLNQQILSCKDYLNLFRASSNIQKAESFIQKSITRLKIPNPFVNPTNMTKEQYDYFIRLISENETNPKFADDFGICFEDRMKKHKKK